MLRTLAAICVAATIAAAVHAQARFTDLAGHWAEPRITALASRGLLDPAAGPFRPEAPIARATFLHWILAARGGGPTTGPASPSFPDVQPNDPSYAAVEAAVAAGILTPAGEPFAGAAPIAREEAIGWIVRGADLAWEAEGFGHATIPALDGAQVSPIWHGSVAVALLGRPALLREPVEPRVRPREPLTRAEAASLVWSYLQAAEGEFRLEQSFDIAGGVRLTTERRGILRNRPVWRVAIPTLTREDAARQLATHLQNRGYAAQVETADAGFRVRMPSFTDRGVAERARLLVVAAGEPATLAAGASAPHDVFGPMRVATLRVQRGATDFEPIRARDALVGRERTSSMADRRGALAAVNAGYFAPDGATIGGIAIDGTWISEPYPGRTCVGVTTSGEWLIDALTWAAEAQLTSGTVPIHGLNRPRRNDELVMYNRWYGPTSRSVAASVEVVVVDNVVREVRRSGGTAIPTNGYVLSAGGAAIPLLDGLKIDDPVTVSVMPNAISGDARWGSVQHMFCGGPRLLASGQVIATGERFNPVYLTGRNPRAGIGVAPDGTVYITVVDGRRPGHSFGMTAVEFAMEMRRHGVVDAVHLDGGGSATLVVRGRVINRPSDAGGERAVADALLLFSRDR